SFCNRNTLFTRIDYEQCTWKFFHVFDTAKEFLKTLLLFFKKNNFFFRKHFKRTVLLPFLKSFQTINTFLNCLEVSKRTTQPTLVDVEVSTTLSFFFN